MPIPTTNKNMIAIAGSVANVSNLIKFMCEIGLISIESDEFEDATEDSWDGGY